MQQWSGGQIAPDTVDEYPQPPHTPTIHITSQDIRRALGIQIPLPQAKTLLEGLEFQCEIRSSEVETLVVTPPPFRMDIGEGITGIADVMEEIARLYGYDNIPETRLADPLPPQRGNPSLEAEEKIRNLLAGLGLQEVITYRMTSPEVEAKLLPSNLPTPHTEYVRLANPIAPEKRVLRRSLLASLLGIAEKNNRLRETLALFEIGAIYLPQTGDLPAEPRRLAISLSGKRYPNGWDEKPAAKLDFYDLKGILEALFGVLHLNITYAPAENPTYHPGKCAAVKMAETTLGVFGELHPLVQENYDFSAPMLAADLDLEAILHALPGGYPLQAVSEYPPIYEDIALIVEEDTPAEKVEALIRQTGGKMLEEVRLFDVFRGEQIGAGKKSLAYALVYRSPEGTLTDKDSAQIRNRIVRRLENETGAKLRS
jgi:phenylalanyl-tRNA synthetase beta chain